MAIRDRRGLEGMPLKLLIVMLLISVSMPVVVSSLGNFNSRTSDVGTEQAAERVRDAITATYISGPGNRRIVEVQLPSEKCSLDIGGALSATESVSIRVYNDGPVGTVYLSDPMVRATSDLGGPYRVSSTSSSLSLLCVSANGTTYVLVGPA